MGVTSKVLGGVAAAAMSVALAVPAMAQGTIKVGVLHSLSGTRAISETTLKDTILMMVDDQNKKGGLLGKKLEAVVVDPASNWPLFAEKVRKRRRAVQALRRSGGGRCLTATSLPRLRSRPRTASSTSTA